MSWPATAGHPGDVCTCGEECASQVLAKFLRRALPYPSSTLTPSHKSNPVSSRSYDLVLFVQRQLRFRVPRVKQTYVIATIVGAPSAEEKLKRRLHSIWRPVVMCAALASAFFARAGGASDPASMFLSKAQWEHMDWQTSEASLAWKSVPWATSGDGSVKEATITIFGAPFKALWMEGILHLDAKDTFPTCDGLKPKMAAKLGRPVEDDGSIVIPYSETRSMKMIAVFYQWDIGRTRIHASCNGSTSSPAEPSNSDRLNWTISIAPLARLPNVIPKFALSCTRKINYPEGTSRDASEIAMWVDPYMKNVTNADGVVIADTGTVSITDSEIRFSATRSAVRSDYIIDRITGSLSATVYQDGEQAGTINGNCEKAMSLGAKF
jgi:hypothetical protein